MDDSGNSAIGAFPLLSSTLGRIDGRRQDVSESKMKNEHIRNLILHLDEDSPFLIEIHRRFFPRKETLTTADRLVHPMGDPAFGIHFVRAYHRAGGWLPDEIWWPSIWRAFCCLRYDSELRGQDGVCLEALALGHPANRAKQALIKGLLCAGMTYEEIGELVGMSKDVVEVYAHLFFDFAERRDDHSFVMKVLNPRAHLNVLNAETNKALDQTLLLMNIGYQLGPKAVVKVLGLSDEWNGSGQEGQPATNIKNALLSAGEMKARLGLLEAGDPEFALVKTLLAEEVKHHPDAVDDDWRMGLGALSFDQAAQHVLKGIIMGNANERLQAQREYDAQAAEEAKRKAAGSRGPVSVLPAQSAA